MSRIACSVGILTRNSGRTLRRALESVRDFSDVFICDGGSTDDTRRIAEEFGCRIVEQNSQFQNTDGTLSDYGGVRNQCLDTAQEGWFLYIDSDETISEGLREEIRRAVSLVEGPLVYRVPVGIILDGRYIQYSSNYPGYQTRFFHKDSGARFVKLVHEKISYDVAKIETGTLSSPWYIHTSQADWRHYVRENAKYRNMEVALYCNEPLSSFIRSTLWRNLRASIGVLLRSIRNYALHGFKKTLPVRGEVGRALSPLIFIVEVLYCKLRRSFQAYL